MNIKLTEYEQNLASENIRLTTELIKRNIKKCDLPYEELYDAAIEALIRSAQYFKRDLGYKFSTLYFQAGDKAIKNKLRHRRAKKRDGTTISITDHTDLVNHQDDYHFFDKELINLAIKNSGLNDTEKQCVYLYYYKQLSQPQIGKLMGYSQTHIGRLLIKGVDKLRKYILEKG